MKPQPILSDEDIRDLLNKSPNVCRAVEALVRKRLAERIREVAKALDEVPGVDTGRIWSSTGLERAARLVEGED